MRFSISLIILLLNSMAIWGQSAAFTISVSNDSVLLGNKIAVTFTIENASSDEVDFPDFVGFNTVSGPNVSTSMRIMNGAVSQSASYTFYLEPLEVGDAYIEPASLATSDGYLETPPQLIRVYPNPDGIIQQPNQQQYPSVFGDDFFEPSPFQNPFRGDDFFNRFFDDTPLMPRDTLKEKPKKRKTTRI